MVNGVAMAITFMPAARPPAPRWETKGLGFWRQRAKTGFQRAGNRLLNQSLYLLERAMVPSALGRHPGA